MTRSSSTPVRRRGPARASASSATRPTASPQCRCSSVPRAGHNRWSGCSRWPIHLDDTYLRVRETGGEPLSFSLVAPAAVLASSGPQPPEGVLLAAAQRAVARSERTSDVVDDRFVVARVGRARMPDPARRPSWQSSRRCPRPWWTTRATRCSATCSWSCCVATLVSVGGAALMGERIGGGLRRLITATERLQAGDLDARARVRRDDELGVLGASFDEMAGSLRATTDELRRTAADEARLRARLEAVFAGMGEALLACDLDRSVTECNRAAAELLGVDPDAVRGRPIDDVVRFTPADRRETVRRRRAGDRCCRLRRLRVDGIGTGAGARHRRSPRGRGRAGDGRRLRPAGHAAGASGRAGQGRPARDDQPRAAHPAHPDQGVRRHAPQAGW